MVILDLLSANYMTSEGSSSVQITITNSLRLSEVVVNVYLNTLYTGSARGKIFLLLLLMSSLNHMNNLLSLQSTIMSNCLKF